MSALGRLRAAQTPVYSHLRSGGTTAETSASTATDSLPATDLPEAVTALLGRSSRGSGLRSAPGVHLPFVCLQRLHFYPAVNFSGTRSDLTGAPQHACWQHRTAPTSLRRALPRAPTPCRAPSSSSSFPPPPSPPPASSPNSTAVVVLRSAPLCFPWKVGAGPWPPAEPSPRHLRVRVHVCVCMWARARCPLRTLSVGQTAE